MDVFDLRRRLVSDYRSYTRSFIKIRDPRIDGFVDGILGAEGFWPEPLLQLNPTFRPGGTIDDLVERGTLHPECTQVFRIDKSDTDHRGKQLILHQHQREAILKAQEGRSYVLTTGTGSGKSLAYIVPIVDHVLRRGSGQGIQAIVVYPMNALANSQHEELGKFIDRGRTDGRPPVRFARYTGQERGEAREAIRSNPPDIVLTNYMMLELLLTRIEDRALVRAARGLRFLVFDELHTYRGRQGADVAMLIRRCRHAFGNDVICVGTSATMASGGGSEDQRLEVAKVSRSLFGVNFTPEQVVSETLERATPEIDTADTSVRDAIRTAVTSDDGPPSDYEAFRGHPLASWIESTFGVQEEAGTGELLRQVPRRLGEEPAREPEGEPNTDRQRREGDRASSAPARPSGEPTESRQSAAAELSELTGADSARCAEVLRQWLLKGSTLRRNDSSRFPIFAFRLHQFLTRGDTVWASIEPEATRHLEIAKQAAKPGEPDKLLYPLVFCRRCGTAYYRVRVTAGEHGATMLPREDRRSDDSDGGEDAYLYLSEEAPWPRTDGPALLERLPDSLKETNAHGVERIRPNARKDVPEAVFVGPDGRVVPEGEGAQAALIRRNFLFCLEPSCRVAYTRSQRSERFKLATLGVDNRSTATTILAVRALIEVQGDRGLSAEARKLLSFTDNRQDAALQAGHFNDFAQVALLRSALYRACDRSQPPGLRHGDLSRAVFDAMNPRFDDFAADPEVRGPARLSSEHALRRALEYFLYRDLERGWRVTAPNLEDCGLLRFDYEGLAGGDGLLAETELWAAGLTVREGRGREGRGREGRGREGRGREGRGREGRGREGRGRERFVPVPDALRLAPADLREEVVRTLLDVIRRALAVKVDALDPRKQHDLVEQTKLRLQEGTVWYLDDERELTHSVVAWPRSGRKGERRDYFVSSYGAYGQYLRRTLAPCLPPDRSFGRAETDEAIRFLFLALKRYGIVEQVRSGGTRGNDGTRGRDGSRGRGDDPGYQLNADALRWLPGDGEDRPIERTRLLDEGGLPAEVNRYFADCYRRFVDLNCRLEAREHTAQVTSEDRQEREARFREGELPLLFCSPTMELGVDIAQLNLVNLRNVPPTPANYAQRSGRAGRGGQPALVFTYCAGRSPHDQYFYREPTRMVAGAVAPPRIDLRNRDLIRAHVHAIWMEAASPNLGRTLAAVLDLGATRDDGRGDGRGDGPGDGPGHGRGGGRGDGRGDGRGEGLGDGRGERLPLPVKEAVRDELRNPAHRGTAAVKAAAVIAEVRAELERTAWFHEQWVDEVLAQVERSFDAACDRWRGLYRAAVGQRALHHAIIGDHSRPEAERNHSRRLRAQAESQIRLLTEAEGVFEGDFYSYRYFATEGFLPGYNFPRLPISAYVPARRGRSGRDEYISRPRFLAISEFGPRALVYHEGARYRVYKVNLDFGSDAIEDTHHLATETMKRCASCGYAHLEAGGANLAEMCDGCGAALDVSSRIDGLVQLQNVSLRLAQRITCDEEERQRFGYNLVTAYRFPEVNGRLDRRDAEVLCDGVPVLALGYGDATDLWRVNLGWTHQDGNQPRGFNLDVERGYWSRNQADAADNDEATTEARIMRVVPFVKDTKNALVMRFEPPRSGPETASLQAAFKQAIQQHFQLEPRELSCEPMPSRQRREEVFFHEVSEGGAGVLRQLVDDSAAVPALARRALVICHYDPDTLEDRAAERCGKACYECLLDYGNQPDHKDLDRALIRDLLADLARAEVRPAGGEGSRAERLAALRTFRLPGREDLGDFTSGRLLRDAARLSTRAAGGPFRSFGRIAVEPRPYQLVPLMMALKLDPVRMLIADDVGIGKTIEACLIARELLDRGEIRRFAVLCPPHLAEQWQRELAEKFHIEAELVLSSTIQRLERDLPLGVSAFDRHPFTVVSTDFIKAPRRAEDFALKCPELVIVDEAHGCTLAGGVGRGRQQRHDLLRRVTADPARHVVLVTATPHSGNEDAFRSLLALLDDDFADLPVEELDRAEREGVRRRLARHLVQRRRADIRRYLETDTAFPERRDKEAAYNFSPAYRALFDDILAFAHEYVAEGASDGRPARSGQTDDGRHEDATGETNDARPELDGRTPAGDRRGQRRRRVRYWSALALLRCVSSSPAAAAATLRSRAAVDAAEGEDVDEVGRRTVLDQGDDDDAVALDFSPGADAEGSPESTRRRLLELARRAEALKPSDDRKLQGAVREIKALLKDGFHPVVFCRFVDTAEYVAGHLRDTLAKDVRVEPVTGRLPPAEREARIALLTADPRAGGEARIARPTAEGGRFVLVCTDCLSEGINLQEHFDAVLHYDLAWNPTRHEQREGRVDRFGQEKPEVRVVTWYGTDNPIDGVILDVLIRKHKSIRSTLGVTVAVPGSSEQIAEALFEGALFRERTGGNVRQLALDFIDEFDAEMMAIHAEWENARDREKASRSRFAQHTLDPGAVAAEIDNVRTAIGGSEDVDRFLTTVLHAANVPVQRSGRAVTVNLGIQTPRALRQAIGSNEPFTGRFDLPLPDGETYLGRTSPIVEGLASWTLDQALDPESRDNAPVASRCGVIATSAVVERTTLLIARFRYHLRTGGVGAGSGRDTLLCEEIIPLACTGSTEATRWLSPEESERLLTARPERNLLPTALEQQLGLTLPALPKLRASLESVAEARAEAQLAAHERVRAATRAKGRVAVEPVLPVDLLGVYVLLPRLM